MGMIMHDDVPYGEGTSYTQGTGIAINNNVIAVDADNAPTENSEKPVKSKGVYSALEANRDESTSLLKSTVGWTGKNLLKPTNAKGTSSMGITYIIDENGADLNGTATAAFNVLYGTIKLPAGQYIYTDGVKTTDKTYFMNIVPNPEPESGSGNLNINSKPYSFTVNSETEFTFIIYVRNGQTVSHLKFYPMLRDASITDDTYEPYHESVEEEVEQIYADNGVLGAKNLLFISTKSETKFGVTFVQNADGSITANGTSEDNQCSLFLISQSNHPEIITRLAGKQVILSGGKDPYKSVQFWISGAGVYIDDTGEGVTFTIPADVANKSFDLVLSISAGQTVTNEVFYPMLRLASDPDDTYVPYAMTNRELTEDKLSISELKTIASSSADFAAFKTAIANL